MKLKNKYVKICFHRKYNSLNKFVTNLLQKCDKTIDFFCEI